MILPEHIADTIPSGPPCPDAVPADIPEEGLDLEKLLEQVERTLLYRALDRARGVKTEAARMLKLTFRSFRHRLQKYETKQ